jgi:hypothetical protein
MGPILTIKREKTGRVVINYFKGEYKAYTVFEGPDSEEKAKEAYRKLTSGEWVL